MNFLCHGEDKEVLLVTTGMILVLGMFEAIITHCNDSLVKEYIYLTFNHETRKTMVFSCEKTDN